MISPLAVDRLRSWLDALSDQNEPVMTRAVKNSPKAKGAGGTGGLEGAQLLLGTGAGAATLGTEEGRADSSVRPPATDSRGAWEKLVAAAEEKLERSFVDLLRNGRDATGASAASPEHSQAPAGARGSVRLGSVKRQLLGRGTPRGLHGCPLSLRLAWLGILNHM
jgi:hypothetical protein